MRNLSICRSSSEIPLRTGSRHRAGRDASHPRMANTAPLLSCCCLLSTSVIHPCLTTEDRPALPGRSLFPNSQFAILNSQLTTDSRTIAVSPATPAAFPRCTAGLRSCAGASPRSAAQPRQTDCGSSSTADRHTAQWSDCHRTR